MAKSKPIHINLLQRNQKKSKRFLYIALVCLGLTIAGAITVYIYHSIQKELLILQRFNAELKTEAAVYEGEQAWLDSYQDLFQRLVQKEKQVKKLRLAQISAVKIYEEIANALPNKMLLVDVAIDQKKIVMKGFAPDHQEVAVFLSGLRSRPMLKDIMLVSSKLDEESEEVEFTIEMGWEASAN